MEKCNVWRDGDKWSEEWVSSRWMFLWARGIKDLSSVMGLPVKQKEMSSGWGAGSRERRKRTLLLQCCHTRSHECRPELCVIWKRLLAERGHPSLLAGSAMEPVQGRVALSLQLHLSLAFQNKVMSGPVCHAFPVKVNTRNFSSCIFAWWNTLKRKNNPRWLCNDYYGCLF